METVDPSVVDSWIQGVEDGVERVLSSPKAGSVWYIISVKWLNKWRSKSGLKTEDMEIDENGSTHKVDTEEFVTMELDEATEENKEPLPEHPEINNAEEHDPVPLENAESPENHTNNEAVAINELGPVNSIDILEFNENHEPALILKKDLIMSKDYEIIPPKAWEYFKNLYGAEQEIVRYSIQINKKETKVEISLKPIRVLYLSSKKIRDEIVTFHFSQKQNLQSVEETVKEVGKKRLDIQNDIKIFLWKCSPEITAENLVRNLNNPNNIFPGTLLKGNDEVQNLEIADEDLIVCEIVRPFENSAYKSQSKYNLETSLSSSSRRGLTGLQNLGNTCFMNSGLQCLSNTHALTKYILDNSYKSQINVSNRIGSKGKIISAYAELIREMWTGSSSSVSPWNLKKALGGFASQFMGYSQQDSQEMLSFLIDGIHEDLNQAPKPKPTEINENGLSEPEIAEEYWKKHLERNSSIIVNLMHGQYRSEVTCLQCNNVSVAFDPFLMLTLPVPQKETMSKEVTVIQGNTVTVLKIEVPSICKARDLLKKLPEALTSENCVVGEAEGYSKEVKRIISKGEFIEKHRDTVVFNYPVISENQTPILCNFSNKSVNEHYGCGTPLGLTKLFLVEKSTLKELHFAIFKQLIQEIEQKDLSHEENLERFHTAFPSFHSDKKDDYYVLSAYNPGRAPCVVCLKETCYGCKLAYSDEPLENFINRSKDPCLFLNIICLGDKSRFASKISGLKQEKRSYVEEKSQKHSESRGLTIDDCLKSFEEVEELDEKNTIYCRKCKTHVKGTKKMDIYKLPNYLIIHLKRFKRQGYGTQKNGAQVNFPLEGLVVRSHSGESISYDLYAVSNHYGSMGGGHYTAYAKNINGNWYDFNDSSVSPLRDYSSITSSAAYVLFYKRSNLKE